MNKCRPSYLEWTLPLLAVVLGLVLSTGTTANGQNIAELQAKDHKPLTIERRADSLSPAVEVWRHPLSQPSSQQLRGRRSSQLSLDHQTHDAPRSAVGSVTVGMFSVVLLVVLPVTLAGFLCCKKMGTATAKLDRKLIVDEASPFDPQNNPMDARTDYSNRGGDLDRKDSCAKADSLYRSDSIHPLGSPTFSTFGAFTGTSASVELLRDEPEKEKVRRKMTKCASEPTLLEESPVALPHTFTGTQPSHVSELLRESHVKPYSGSTVSLVPGPSLTHNTASTSSLFTPPQPSPTLAPVYIIPPEVEKVEIRPGRSPHPERKPPPVPPRLNGAARTSLSVSTSSGQQQSLSMPGVNSEPTQTPFSETDQPTTVFRAVARINGAETSSRREVVRHSTASNTSNISYFLTQEAQPSPRSDAKLSASTSDLLESRPPSFCKMPSPLHARSGRTAHSDTPSDMKQRALPPTPDQIHSSPRHSPLKRTSGTLPLKRHRSPLLSSELFKDETSLDSKRSREAPPTYKQERDIVGASRTLPTKKRGQHLMLKSITHADPVYHQLQSASLPTESDIPPPRPPRKLIDPTRQIDFSRLIRTSTSETSGPGSVRSDAGDSVMGGASEDADIWTRGVDEEEAGVCMNCGKHITAEPFYICVADSEVGSTRGSVTNTPEVAESVGSRANTPEVAESVGSRANTPEVAKSVGSRANTPEVAESVGSSATAEAVQTTGTLEVTDTTSVFDLEVIDTVMTHLSDTDEESVHERATTLDSLDEESLLGMDEPIATHSEGEDPVVNEPFSPASPMSTGAPHTECALDSLSESECQPISIDSQVTLPASPSSVVLSSLELDEEVRPKPPTRPPPPSAGPPPATANEDGLSFEEELRPGSVICMDCVKREGPIYHELEPAEIEAILSGADLSVPPIPPRERPSKASPVYERIASVKRKLTFKLSTGSKIITRVSLDGAYIIEASKPRRLRYRRDSSTDYEHVSTDLETPTSPHYHKASEVHQLGGVVPPTFNPADHVRCKPHPPPLVTLRGKSGSHDYESLPGSLEGRPVNLHGLANRQGSHDYAFIGPAPSIESLRERSVSPPYVPPKSQRATLMKIDSQGYASVIPDHSDDFDCLRSIDRECPFHASVDSVSSFGPLTMRVPNDYEVPTIVVPEMSGTASEETRTKTKTTPTRLARQKTVYEPVEEMAQTSSQSNESDSCTVPDTAESESKVQDTSYQSNPLMESTTEETQADSVVGRGKSAPDRDSAVSSEDVFDSGIENSSEGFEITSPKVAVSSISLPPPRPPRPLSLSELNIDTVTVDSEASPPRPRAMTFHPASVSPQTSDKKLSILLNQQSSVIV